jgi:hypothetical protein
MAHAALALSERGGGRVEAASVRRMCDQEGDEWGAALAAWLEGIGLLWHDSAAVEVLEEVVARLVKLGAGTLEAWCRSFLALARAQAGEPRAHESAVQAELFARQTKVRGAQGLAVRVLAATSEGERQAEFARLAVAIAAEGGNDWDVLVERALGSGAGPATGSAAGNGAIASDPDSQPSAPWLTVRCLGGFSLSIGERLVDLNPLKPRARAVLRLLALYGDQGMHREQLVDALWPEIDPLAATRNLHVAISAATNCWSAKATATGSSSETTPTSTCGSSGARSPRRACAATPATTRGRSRRSGGPSTPTGESCSRRTAPPSGWSRNASASGSRRRRPRPTWQSWS